MSRLCALVAILVGLSTGTAAAAPYTALHRAYRAEASFVVSYRGIGFYGTTFNSHPPNPGGADDVNDARDSSAQAWVLRFRDGIAIPACGQPAGGGTDPCSVLTGLSGAVGRTTLTGEVSHVHVDGLYRELDRTVKCRLLERTAAGAPLDASIALRYLPGSKSVGVTAYNPVVTALSLFPSQCAGQGDSIERVFDFYAPPGFSFDGSYDANRWFTSREVLIPAAVFHRAQKIRIPLSNTQAGRPPPDCAVADPSFERCATGGSWDGILTLTAVAPKS